MDVDLKAVLLAFLLQNGLLILLLTLASVYILSPYLDPKRRRLPPGPIGLPVLGYLPFIPNNYDSKFQQLFKKYGKIFCLRLGSADVVFVSDFDVLKKVSKLDHFNERPDLSIFSSAPKGNLVTGTLSQPWVSCMCVCD